MVNGLKSINMRTKGRPPSQEIRRLEIELAVRQERASQKRKRIMQAFEVVIRDAEHLISVRESAEAQSVLEYLRNKLKELKKTDHQETEKWQRHYLASKFSS
jgi:hypothetical protein